jgi:KaiC/GvpD/RAD55 family RecA-like ATPase
MVSKKSKTVHKLKHGKRKGKKEINKSYEKDRHKQILEQRAPIAHISKLKDKKEKKVSNYLKTGIPGFDELFEKGIPQGNTVLVAGGAGSGKTIFCLQTLAFHAAKGDKCFYMSFEENEERLNQHMTDFGWNPEKLLKSGKLKIERYSPFDITRSVDAMLAKEKGELLIEIDPVIIPSGFRPDFIVLDSLTAIASTFTGKEDSYRIYIEQLFRFFEKLGSTVFLITETKQIPEIFSTTGVEEFLADGVIVLYNIKRGDIRESAIEVLKMRGEKHQKKIVAMQITNKGIVVYPEQEVFGGLEESKE